MHDLYNLKEELIKELGEIGKQGVTKSNIEMIDKIAHAAKNVEKVIECCEEKEYSMAMGNSSYARRGSSYRGGGSSYRGGGSYAEGGGSYAGYSSDSNYVRPDGSYARGRDSMGRYSRAGDEMISQLERLMETAPDERTKSEIRNLMQRL